MSGDGEWCSVVLAVSVCDEGDLCGVMDMSIMSGDASDEPLIPGVIIGLCGVVVTIESDA